MKAVCTTPDRTLELRDIPAPTELPPGYLLVDIIASAINHGVPKIRSGCIAHLIRNRKGFVFPI